MKAFHTTKEEYITSIAKFGLIPNYGLNTRSVTDNRRKVFFSSNKGVDFWRKTFAVNDEITLIFNAENESPITDPNNIEMYTTQSILPTDIKVKIGDKEIDLSMYYSENREYFDNLFSEMFKNKFKDFQESEHTLDTLIEGMDLLGFLLVYENDDKETITGIIKSKLIKNLKDNNASDFLSEKFESVIKTMNIEDIFELKSFMSLGYNYDPSRYNLTDKNNRKAIISIEDAVKHALQHGIETQDVLGIPKKLTKDEKITNSDSYEK